MADKPQKNTQKSRKNSERTHFISECRESRIIVPVRLSQGMYRIYRKHFDRFSRAAFLFRFYSKIARGNSVESTLSEEIISQIDLVNDSLRKKIKVADQLIKNNRVNVGKAVFGEYNVTIIDPLANRFLSSILLAQELNDKLSALWLACVLDDGKRAEAEKEIESELGSIKDKCTTISFGVKDHVKAQRPQAEQSPGTEADGVERPESRTVAVTDEHDPASTEEEDDTDEEVAA
ncbi:MAG: hypothetical protein NTV43_16110 [Methylococcales bacterium]|nr:hypothetical protein [Methylococcales bacterium]